MTLSAQSSHDRSRTVKNILVGDVWHLTGSGLLTSKLAYDPRDREARVPATLPLVREFRRKTKASTSEGDVSG